MSKRSLYNDKRAAGRDPITGKKLPMRGRDEMQAARIEAMARTGLSRTRLAILEDIAPDDLDALYSRDIELGQARAIGAVGQVVLDAAMGGDLQTARWWLERQAPESFGRDIEASGTGAILIQINLDGP